MRKIPSASKFVWMSALVCCLLASTGRQVPAQSAEGVPAPSNIGQAAYPRILADNRVVFQVRAPKAGQVQINLGHPYDLQKDESGSWTVTTAPQDPGFHYYSLVIDGVSVADPASESYYGTGRMSSAIEIPEAGVDFYTVKDVPHGDIRSKRYFSKVTNSWRRLNVYTPPGYDKDTDKKYPVLYIQHGGGEDETGWAVQGKTDIILDNLIAAGKAKPMLVVIANGNVPTSGGAAAAGTAAPEWPASPTSCLNNIIPFIESHYRVLANAENRALAGLSMGGGQAFFVGLGNKDKFGSIGDLQHRPLRRHRLARRRRRWIRRRGTNPRAPDERQVLQRQSQGVLHLRGRARPSARSHEEGSRGFQRARTEGGVCVVPGRTRMAGLAEVPPRFRSDGLQVAKWMGPVRSCHRPLSIETSTDEGGLSAITCQVANLTGRQSTGIYSEVVQDARKVGV